MTIYHVAVGYEKKELPSEKIQEAFKGSGWARYAPNCWLVDSTSTAEQLTDRIRKIVSADDSIFVVEINPNNHQGYLQKEIWTWFNKARTGRW